MADEPMLLERIRLGLLRNLPGVYIALTIVVAGLVLLLWYAYGPVSAAWMWGVSNKHTAMLHHAPVKLPEGWREHNAVGRSDLHLERPFTWHARMDIVDVDELSGPDADFQRMLNTLKSLEKTTAKEGDVAGVYPLSDSNAARFVCMEHGNKDEETLHVTCLERDGLRVVRMNGYEDSQADFAAILSSITAMPPVLVR